MFFVSAIKLSVLASYLFGSIACNSIIATTVSEDWYWDETFWD
jgi:hypothetical protein